MADPQAQQKFQQLRQQYVQGLPQRIQQIRTAWDRLQHVSWDPKVLNFMTHAVHKLTGSGSTFRFPEITANASTLEQQLIELQAKAEASPEERQLIVSSLEALNRAINQASGGQEEETGTPGEDDTAKPEFNIAVVEDDPAQASQLHQELSGQGYHVDVFADPETYSRRAQEKVFQLILLDVGFPEGPLEGLAWLERLRGHVGSHVPIAIMSARTDMVARMRALQAGADIFLTKPLDLNFLARRIRQLHESATDVCPRVLWVDDDKDLLNYYRNLLTERGYQVDCLSQSVRLLERIERFQPDVIVLDYQMPSCNGLELARILRQDPRYMTIPILFVSATADLQNTEGLGSLVGNAYFQKPLDDEAFINCLQAQIVKAQLIAARIDLLSQRHEVSGLQNQDYFIDSLEHLMGRLSTDETQLARTLIQLAIDNEPYIKARLGTRRMIELTGQLEKHLASHPLIGGRGCHLGGGSYLLLAEGTTPDDNRTLTEALRTELSELPWLTEQVGKSLTVSMGALPLNHGLDVDQALSQVEQACATAIREGGDRIEWHEEEPPEEQPKLNEHIQELLQNRSFTLHFQPVMNMETEDTMFESLVRLVDDDQVVYMPSQFLPSLPSDRGHYDLDRWVIEHAVENLAKLEGKASASHSVIIKLSSSLADVARMQPFITNVIRSSRVKGQRRIFLAFSCPSVVKEIPTAQSLFATLQQLGFGIIVEHVTLNSNIVQLLKDVGNVDFVKLRPALGSRDGQTRELDQLLTQLSAHFGSPEHIIVTGVEDARVLSRFWEQGIRYFQGYFIQKPGIAMHYSDAG
ncbi:response regulator [Marinobacter sp. JSM 1782161]|uniref:response regulator n=1 Tax=Marinobacter sp. JSM 1782161 TaxID=2685906 RepID=UPI00140352CD|nr:response regulator [Marinobacter sp. JSM 1782161]